MLMGLRLAALRATELRYKLGFRCLELNLFFASLLRFERLQPEKAFRTLEKGQFLFT